MRGLKGKTFVITGVSAPLKAIGEPCDSIGIATTKRMIQEEAAHVFFTALTQAELDPLFPIFEKLNEGRANPTKITGLVLDLTSKENIEQVVQKIHEVVGDEGVDGLFNCAGVVLPQRACSLDWDRMSTELNCNFRGTVWLTKLMTAEVINRKTGSVVICSSIGARLPLQISSIYCATKAALQQWMRTWASDQCDTNDRLDQFYAAVEAKKQQAIAEGLSAEAAAEMPLPPLPAALKGAKKSYIRINAVAPGPIDTPFYDKVGFPTEAIKAAFMKEQEKMMWLRRLGRSDEVAGSVAFLFSDDATFIHGATIDVDGGM